MPIRTAAIICLFWYCVVHAQELIVQLPADAKITSASMVAAGVKSQSNGVIEGQRVRFAKLLPRTPYDVTLTLAGGTVLQGVDLRWYNEEAVDPVANPMTDEDRAAIGELIKPDKDFWNKQEILFLVGDHNRATVLVKLIRDRDFYSDSGGEIICRFDLWYFRFEAGGWMKIQQGQRQLRRDRFKSRAAYEQAISPIRWTPELGGIRLEPGQSKTITLSALPEATTTQPTSPTAPPPARPSP